MRKLFYFIFSIGFFALFACNNPVTPKPKGYSKVTFPAKEYQLFEEQGYPYAFEYPIYAQISKQASNGGDGQKVNNWINLNFPENKGTLYISYFSIKPGQLDTLIGNAYNYVNKHNSMASSMQDSAFRTANGISGVFFHIGGDVATQYQFYLTDSSRHFFRGALYFDTTPNEDSLAPVNAFIFKDMVHLVNTFKWQ